MFRLALPLYHRRDLKRPTLFRALLEINIQWYKALVGQCMMRLVIQNMGRSEGTCLEGGDELGSLCRTTER